MSFSSASLDNTTAWLQAAESEEASAVRSRSESPGPDSRGPVSASAVLIRAYMRLLHWDPQDQKYPEVSCSLRHDITLRLSSERYFIDYVEMFSLPTHSSSHCCLLKHVTTH